jgi:hypothetical protein
VPAGNAGALICDTGALIDYRVESALDHTRFREAIDQARPRHVAGLVLAEVDYFLRNVRDAMRVFMQDLARGAFTYAPPTLGQLSRAMEVDRRFAARPGPRRWLYRGARRVARHLSSGDARRAPHRRRWWFIQRIPTVPDSQSASRTAGVERRRRSPICLAAGILESA